MTIQELNNHILHYLKKDKTQTAIMLTGEWGSGKTYYIEHELVPYLKSQKASCIVVSLYGMESISEISKSIYMELRLPTFGGAKSEGVTTGKVIARNVLKNLTSMVGIDVTLPNEQLEEIYQSVNLKDKLLILEDIERSNIDLLKVLGYVNGLVERDNVKVLLVANEKEILGKETQKISFDFTSQFKKLEDVKELEEKKVPEMIVKYLRIKEKTISDTIQFSGELKKSIKEICLDFHCDKLSSILDEEVIDKISGIVADICKKNLRTFIFAVQKSVDIIDSIKNTNLDADFYKALLIGVLHLSAIVKSDDFPKWEGSEFLSTKLGTYDIPLMRFAYDYVRWQTFEEETVLPAYEAYKEYKLFERHAEYNDADLRFLSNYAEQTEKNVFLALKNIEEKLHQPDAIGIHAYCKLAYYMIYVGNVVGYDSTTACNLMLKNAKGIARKINIEADILFASTYEIEDEEIDARYKGFVKKLADSMKYDKYELDFSYKPDDLIELYDDICRNTHKYKSNHRFISKYNCENMIKMLRISTSKQIGTFRGILFAVYRHATKGEFDEKDIDTMKKLKKLIEKEKLQENNWDKIQIKQINWLVLNLEQFISQME